MCVCFCIHIESQYTHRVIYKIYGQLYTHKHTQILTVLASFAKQYVQYNNIAKQAIYHEIFENTYMQVFEHTC